MTLSNDPLINRLVSKLTDRDPRNRCIAANSLRFHGPRALSALPALAQLLNDDDLTVRSEAERTLQLLNRFAA